MITEQNCFRIELLSEITVSSGLQNPWVYLLGNVGGGIAQPKLF